MGRADPACTRAPHAIASRSGALVASLAALVFTHPACASDRAAKWNERGENFLRSRVDHRVAPVTEASLRAMAAPGFDWKGYWIPTGEIPAKYAKAAHAFSRAVQIQPDVPRFHVNLGLSLLGLRQPDRAEESFRRALVLDPGCAEATRGLAAAQASLRARSDAQPAIAVERR